jgi:hypothetical protein
MVTTNLGLPWSLHREVKIYAMAHHMTIVKAMEKLLEQALESS